MSMNFEHPITEQQQDFVRELMGDKVKALDEKVALFDSRAFRQNEMKQIANEVNQPVTVELNDIGDRKEVGGIVYELDAKGWRKLPIGTTL